MTHESVLLDNAAGDSSVAKRVLHSAALQLAGPQMATELAAEDSCEKLGRTPGGHGQAGPQLARLMKAVKQRAASLRVRRRRHMS